MSPHRIDLFEAVKYDIRLHGFWFIAAEFSLATLGALFVTAVELTHAVSGFAPVLGASGF